MPLNKLHCDLEGASDQLKAAAVEQEQPTQTTADLQKWVRIVL